MSHAAFAAARTLAATMSQVLLFDDAYTLLAVWSVPGRPGNDGVNALAITPDGRFEVMATGLCGVFRWDLDTLQVETLSPAGEPGFHHGVGQSLLGNNPLFMDGVAISADGACVAALRRDIAERETAMLTGQSRSTSAGCT